MSQTEIYLWVSYLSPIVLVIWFYIRRSRKSRKSQEILNDNEKAGLTEPASLHPVFNPSICVGTNACVVACPEGTVIGLIKGKAHLIRFHSTMIIPVTGNVSAIWGRCD